jgi:hypothetical protein
MGMSTSMQSVRRNGWRFQAGMVAVGAALAISPAGAALPPGYTIEGLVPPGEAHSVSVRGLYDDGSLGIEVSRGSTPNTVGNVAAYHRNAAGVWRQATIPAGNNQINQLGAVGPEGNMYGTWRFNNDIFDQRVFVSTAAGAFTDMGRFNNAAGNLSNTFVGAATAEYFSARSADVGYLVKVSDLSRTVLPTLRSDGLGLASVFGSNLDNGWFVGLSPQAIGSNQTRATLWRQNPGGDWLPTNLGLAPGAGDTETSTARGLNDQGIVTGWTGTLSSNNAYVWIEGQGMQLLPRSSASSHLGYDINSDNLVVGYRNVGSSLTAVVWPDFDSTPIDLITMVENATGWQLLDAQYINDSGQIMGRGMLNGINTTFLLTPIPEPATLSLAGLSSLLLLRRRR